MSQEGIRRKEEIAAISGREPGRHYFIYYTISSLFVSIDDAAQKGLPPRENAGGGRAGGIASCFLWENGLQ